MEGFTMQLDGMDIVKKAQDFAIAAHAAIYGRTPEGLRNV